MKRYLFEWPDISIVTQLSVFESPDENCEYHAIIESNNAYLNVKEQFANVEKAILRIKTEFKTASLIFKRYFVSDAVNQAEFLTDNSCAVSIVEQAPTNGSKVAVWAYFVDNCTINKDKQGTFVMERPFYKHLYNTQLHFPLTDEKQETRLIFENYANLLAQQNCRFIDNCIRTWIFVQNIDIHYTKIVGERKKFFEQQGLTPETHYITSTGIEGRYINPKTLVFMDIYAVQGIQNEQVSYIKAPTHLNPAYEYGVTFERATSVDYGDRKHVFVSGTASINGQGEIVFPGDVIKQTGRVLENIEALLVQAECCLENLAKMIAYLRDTADYFPVKQYFENLNLNIPYLIVRAPVCRPGWLIEIEAIAIKKTTNGKFKNF